MAFLRFTTGPRAGESVELEKAKTSFGRRRSSDCVLDHKAVSRDHFHIERIGAKYFLVDNDSGNGTFVNGDRVTWVELKDGDVVQVGSFGMMADLSGLTLSRDDAPENADLLEEGVEAFTREHEEAYPRQFIEGIRYFNQRNYYDAHEVWEEIWLHASGDEKVFYQMLIQSAVGLHHYERGNARGARGMYNAAAEKLRQLPREFMSLDLDRFSRDLTDSLKAACEDDADSITIQQQQAPRPHIKLLPLSSGRGAQ